MADENLDVVPLPAGVDEKTAALAAEVAQARAQAEAMEVTTPEQAQIAAAHLSDVNRQKREAEKERKALKEPILEAGRRLDARYKEVMAALDEADRVLRGKLGTWQAEQERLRAEEEARLRAEQQERERAEREAREAQERHERERREAAEADRREAEKLAQEARDEEEREQAEELAAQSKREAAEAAERQKAIADAPPPAPVPAAKVAPAAPPAGIQTKKVWKATVVDEAAVPREYLVVDEVAIRAAVREGAREIPGVKIEQIDQLAVRG